MALPKHVLDGVRVLDFTQALAGPTTTRLMAEMGAEIIKVELAPGGDASRALPFFRNGRSGYYIQQNRGKKSICIDRKNPRAIELVKKVAEHCDVLVENFAPGAIARLGFGWEEVHRINPRLIMGSISAFGQTGPLSKLPGYDYIGASYAGVLSMIGEPDGPPYFYMLGIGDVMTGTHLLAAITGALFQREKTGKGQYVETSLLDAYFHCHEVNVQCHTASGGEFKPHRSGLHHWAGGPLGIFKCKVGYVYLAVLPNQWPNFCKVIGRPEMETDPRFVDNAARVQNRDELNAIIHDYLDRYPSAVAAAEDMGAKHIPIAPVLSVAEAVKHPHLIERGTIRTIHDDVFGDYQVPGMPLRFSEFPGQLDLRADYLGEHNVEVFTKYAGVSEAEVRRLEQEGALIAKPDLERAQAAE